MVAVKSGSLKDSSAWGAELRRHLGPELSQGHSRPAGLLALAAAHALLAAVHAGSRLELTARRCALGLRSFTGDISWQTSAVAALALASLWGFKRLLDVFSATDGALHAAAAAGLALHGLGAAARFRCCCCCGCAWPGRCCCCCCGCAWPGRCCVLLLLLRWPRMAQPRLHAAPSAAAAMFWMLRLRWCS